MENINAQEYIDKKYPINEKCKRNADKTNKDKRREDITDLDIRKGKVGSSKKKILFGALKLEGFTNLQTLIISSHELTSLDASACKNLEELDCNLIHNNNTDSGPKPQQNSSQKVKKERNTKNSIEQELFIKRGNLEELQNVLSPELTNKLAKTFTKYFFENHKQYVEGKESKGYHSKNLSELKKESGSDSHGNEILDQILYIQKEIIDLEKVKSIPPYYDTQLEIPPKRK
ncbi:16251_t:CDS:2 [Gigaspora rosea]|nr:16251_t:CDS:2 [Gigaspora rosea]